jgi:preprotein translocase subunit SecA
VRGGFVPELVAQSFALVRTAAARTVGLRHFPVQLIGGSAMLERQARRNGDGRREDLTGDAAGCDGGARRDAGARGHRQ